MKKPKPPAPTPDGLSPDAAALRETLLQNYLFDDAGLSLLDTAMLAKSRADRCRAIIDKDGECVPDRFGVPKAHPLLPAEVQSRALYIRAIRELGLNLEEVKAPGRPPGR